MLMHAQLLRQPALGPEKVLRASEAIERSTKAQSQLIDDLLDVSRIVTGKLSCDLRRLDLAGVVQAALRRTALAAERKHVRIEAALDAAIGLVSGDSVRLQQVVTNLLTNAIKFTPEQGEVKVTLDNDEGEALLRVSDTGSGIEPDFLPFVFDRFTQQDSSSARRHGGLGLGLSIVGTSSSCTAGPCGRRAPAREQGPPSRSGFPSCERRRRSPPGRPSRSSIAVRRRRRCRGCPAFASWWWTTIRRRWRR